MTGLFGDLAAWSVWLVAGCALLVTELALPGVFLMWLGLAAIGTGLLTLAAGLGRVAEVAAFALLAVGSLWLGVRLRRPGPAMVNTPQSGLVGRRAVALAFIGAEGRVRVGDADWAARTASGVACAPGEILSVVAVEGMVLIVDAA